MIVGRKPGQRAGAALLAAAALVAGAPPASAASVSADLPSLPWGALATVVDVVDALTSPLTSLGGALASAGDTVAPLRPVGELLGLADAGLPVAADGLRLVGTVADVEVPASGTSDGPTTWHLPALPDISSEVAAVSGGTQALDERMASAIACDCLPFGLTERLADVQPKLADAAWAMDTFGPALAAYPALGGFDGPRTYLVIIGNQAEMRASGGAPLYAAVVTADDGTVTVVDKGATSTHFFPPMNRPVTWTGDASNPFFAENPRTQPFVNAGANPDFAASGAELAAAFEAGGFPTVDGVIYADLTFLQEVLRITGPVEVSGVGTIDADTLAVQLLDNAYEQADSPEENARRQAANDALVDALLNRVAAGVPTMAALHATDTALAGRHLQVWFRDPATQDTVDALGWTGRLSAPAERQDWLAWFTQSGNPSKTDIKQGRTATRSVRIDGSTARVTTDYVVTNDNEPSADPGIDDRRGYQASWMKTAILVYLPTGATDVVAASGDLKDAPLPGATRDGLVMTDAAGNRFLRFSGWIPPLGSATVTVDYSLASGAGDAPYRVVLEPQANLLPYSATVCIDGDAPACSGPSPITQRTTIALP